MKKHIPNLITTGNLLCGCLAIVKAFEGDLAIACYLLIIASALDFLDGFAARMLNVSGGIGKDLDSLSDMISFGLAPGLILYQYVKVLNQNQPVELLTQYPWLMYIAFIIPVFSSFRLAKFNNDTRQSTTFYGLPTPANANFFIFCILLYLFPDLPMVIDVSGIVQPIVSNPLIILGFGVVFSFLLVAEIPMFALKFKSMKWADNKLPFSFVLLWLGLLIFTNIAAMPIIVIIYVVWSIIAHYFLSPNKQVTN
ncbi:MAG: hypothetical protein VR77_06700 [Flavobacteriales bacterium BRH_c54]|nr:MAG: hypothetical protein VR77_06700 [Flavobacteriales bacterium BRH_c54]